MKVQEREVVMENAGLIIRKLRAMAGMSVQKSAIKIGCSAGWLSEIENGTGTSRIDESEFNRVVDILNGTSYRSMFKTWAATSKNLEKVRRDFDGAILKFIRKKKKLRLSVASELTGYSTRYLSNIENGHKLISQKTRDHIMASYGYSPSSFKNLSTDPIRSKAVPCDYKLAILLRKLNSKQVFQLFEIAQKMIETNKE